MMNKRKMYQQIVYPLLKNKQNIALKEFILSESSLPGRMGNLTLIKVVAENMTLNQVNPLDWYPIFSEWLSITSDGNDPYTDVLLTGLESLGAIYQFASEEMKKEIDALLHQSLNDPRWRVREIVTESYKWIGTNAFTNLTTSFDILLLNEPTPLEIRGILATIAHPNLLKTTEQLAYAQKIMSNAFDYFIHFDSTKFSMDDKKILQKGLAFAPSVIVSCSPNIGFDYFDELITLDNQAITRLIKENLKKKRLSQSFPDEVQKLLHKIE